MSKRWRREKEVDKRWNEEGVFSFPPKFNYDITHLGKFVLSNNFLIVVGRICICVCAHSSG